MLLGLIKEITDTGGTYAYEHFYKVRAADGEERHPSLSCHSLGQQGLTCTRRAKEQYTLRNLGSQLIILVWMLQELYYLFQLLLGLVSTSHIGEMNLYLISPSNLGTAAAKGHHLAATGLGLIHEEEPEGCQENNRQQAGKQAGPPWWLRRIFCLYHYILGLKLVHQVFLLIWEPWHYGLELGTI